MFPVIGGFLLLLCLSDVLCNLLQQLFSLRRQATDSVNLYVKVYQENLQHFIPQIPHGKPPAADVHPSSAPAQQGEWPFFQT